MAREDLVMNHEKLLRLYREEDLRVRLPLGRKRAMGRRAPKTLPHGEGSLHFASDTLCAAGASVSLPSSDRVALHRTG